MLDTKAEKQAAASKPATKSNGSTPQAAPRTVATTPSLQPRPASPIAFMRRFVEEMDHLFEDFGLTHGLSSPRIVSRGRELLRREAGLVHADWSPEVDVSERDGRLIVRADLPGLGKEDIKVEVRGDLLTIEGVRKQEASEDRAGHYYSECSYGRFYRAIPLPDGAEIESAKASFRDGVLEISMPSPKSAGRAFRQIPVVS